jgi:tripartite-type tricarboxylate transporter receptor subunit TctC
MIGLRDIPPVPRAANDPRESTMKLPRRRFLHLAAGAAALPAVARIAWAQAYPTRPVRIIVGLPAGTPPDIMARLLGQWLSERLGQAFVVENRPGAGGNIATDAVVKAPPDGYTLLQVNSSHAWNAALYDRLNFNFIRDIAPIASIYRQTGVMEVHPSFPAKTVPEFIAYAKANPGKLNMASTGNASATHIYGELFKMTTGVEMVHVPYRGQPFALTALLAGEAHVFFDSLSTSIEHIRAGKFRALGVTVATRVEVLPDVPAVGDFVPGYEASGFLGFGAPKSTPVEVVDKLNREINAGLADPKIRDRRTGLGASVLRLSPNDFGKLIAAETEKWVKVVKFAGLKPE